MQENQEKVARKFIFIGGTDEVVNTKLKEIIQESFKDQSDVFPVVIGTEEASYLAHLKQEQGENESFNEYIAKKDNLDNARNLAKAVEDNYGKFADKDGFIQIKKIKSQTQYSWKEFKEILGMFTTYGFIEFNTDRTKIKVNLLNTERLAVKKVEISDWRKGFVAKLKETLAVAKTIDESGEFEKEIKAELSLFDPKTQVEEKPKMTINKTKKSGTINESK